MASMEAGVAALHDQLGQADAAMQEARAGVLRLSRTLAEGLGPGHSGDHCHAGALAPGDGVAAAVEGCGRMLGVALVELKALRAQAKQHREVQRSLNDALDAYEKDNQALAAQLHCAAASRSQGGPGALATADAGAVAGASDQLDAERSAARASEAQLRAHAGSLAAELKEAREQGQSACVLLDAAQDQAAAALVAKESAARGLRDALADAARAHSEAELHRMTQQQTELEYRCSVRHLETELQVRCNGRKPVQSRSPFAPCHPYSPM